jgi:hypothetical protein
MALFGEFDRLPDGGIGRHAAHMEKLLRAEPQQVDEIRIEPYEATAHPVADDGIEPSPVAKRAVHELLRPTAIARVQRCGAPFKGGVEQQAAAKVCQRFGGGEAGVGDAGVGGRRSRHS